MARTQGPRSSLFLVAVLLAAAQKPRDADNLRKPADPAPADLPKLSPLLDNDND